ncbi:hypothetical protein ScPMuIL_009406 [Solemya velum]
MATIKTTQNVCMILIAFSVLLQCVGFVSPYWVVLHETKERYSIFFGLWHEVHCFDGLTTNRTECHPLTHHQGLQEATERGDERDTLRYRDTIPRAVRATMALALALAAFVLSNVIIFSRKVVKKSFIQKCSLALSVISILSGAFVIPVVIDFIPMYVHLGTMSSSVHVELPWSPLFSGFGGVFVLIPGSLMLYLVCRDFNKPFARRQISTLASEMQNGLGGEGYHGGTSYQPLEEWIEPESYTPMYSASTRSVTFQDEANVSTM